MVFYLSGRSYVSLLQNRADCGSAGPRGGEVGGATPCGGGAGAGPCSRLPPCHPWTGIRWVFSIGLSVLEREKMALDKKRRIRGEDWEEKNEKRRMRRDQWEEINEKRSMRRDQWEEINEKRSMRRDQWVEINEKSRIRKQEEINKNTYKKRWTRRNE